MITNNNEQITARVSEQVKDTITIDADIVGATLNQFLIQSALEKAEHIIERIKLFISATRIPRYFFMLY